MWTGRLPVKYRDVGPRVERVADNAGFEPTSTDTYRPPVDVSGPVDWWVCEDRRSPVSIQGSPRTRHFRGDGTGEDFYARSYDDMIEAAYEPSARLEAMDEDGVWAALMFPTYLRFAATGLLEVKDKEGLGLAMVCAYNDWHVDEWCAAAPDRFIPMMILPLWDPAAAAEEIRRCAGKGFRAITMTENPEPLGLPSYWTDHWDPVFRAAEETGLVLCMHIGTSGSLVRSASEASLDVSISLCGVNAMTACTDLIFSGILNRHPGVKIALSEGGSGWAAYLVERMDYTWERSRLVKDRSLRPSELFARHIWTCFISDQTAIDSRYLLGVDKLMWEGDFPHNDSQYPESRRMLEKALADVPGAEAHQIAESNARQLFNFPR